MSTEPDKIVPDATLRILPVWKKGASAEDFFYDMAIQARKYPDRFNKIIVGYEENVSESAAIYDYYCHNTSTIELLGLLEMMKAKVLERTGK